MNSLSLSELLYEVQNVVNQNFERVYWIRAEISDLRENGGHCYLELVEKNEGSETPAAKIRASIWANLYRMLKPHFETVTGETLRAGLEVMVAVTVEFHVVYGISLNIKDIDPVFTVGEIALRRQQIIAQLTEEGIIDMNRQMPLPPTVQRLAVISSATAAGYGDFCHQLLNNDSGFKFYLHLFGANMQGETAVESIVAALEKIYEHKELFDAVVIIRGGGATTDLACFDSYYLALNCAQFPLPILAGIGHLRDMSIVDRVAYHSAKTPTAIAEFLIDRMQMAENKVLAAAETITDCVKNAVYAEERRLENAQRNITYRLQSIVERKKFEIERRQNRIEQAAVAAVSFQKNRLLLLENKINALSPLNLLKRGYSITCLNGVRLHSKTNIRSGQRVKTILSDGSFESVVA